MAFDSTLSANQLHDPVSNVLKWILLAVALLTFGAMGWATVLTYERAPQQPERFVSTNGETLMTSADLLLGKEGFQKADLMDYGSLYGMGSYYGEDYTASVLVRTGTLTQEAIARARFGKPVAGLDDERRAATKLTMQKELQGLDLTKQVLTVPDPVASAIVTEKAELSQVLATAAPDLGWTPAYSLNKEEAVATADFLIYSALTTVARRPDVNWSWTENWPYEPLVGNTPTTNTFRWTWISFCFTFFAFGIVLFIYEF